MGRARRPPLHDDDAMNWREFAVLYRTNAQSRVVEEPFMRLGVPYKVVGGTRFYDRREIKDAMAYLRAVVNPADEVSVKRVLNVPKRGVGDASIASSTRSPRPTARRSSRRCAAPTRPASRPALRGIESSSHCSTSSARWPATDSTSDRPGDVLQAALDGPATWPSSRPRTPSSPHGRLENLAELVGSARESTRIDEFLEQVSLVADTDDLDDDDRVVLMTLHSAKGLEFPIVFLDRQEDGIFPHIRALTEPDELEEERRLAYVGITRACGGCS